MKNVLLALFCGVVLFACNKPPKEEATTPVQPVTPPQAEIGDPKYADIGKAGIQQLASGDIDGWMTSFADNAKYYWSGGDSLIGKKAITDYWKERRGKVIETLSYANDIWTPLKVNTPQRGPDAPGNWLFSWYQVSVTYKNHQSLKFWVHTAFHFDVADKIDIAVQFIDRAPINAALAKK
jgi:hypothetical protein